jgi:flagellar hook-associated protein 1 FlgK
MENAVSGLLAFQQSLATTSHNISNVNTEGYSRQRAELATMDPIQIGSAGYMGTGVKVASVTRSYDRFLTAQINTSTSTSAQLDTYNSMVSQIDNFIADQESSLPAALTSFFNSIHNLANDPTSIPVRQGVLTTARSLVDRLNTTSGQLDKLRDRADRAIEDSMAQINSLSSNIAEANRHIVDAIRASGGDPPNDLLDQRDQLLVKLAKELDIQVVPDNSGAVNVLVGSGQALVTGNVASSLKLTNSPYLGAPKDVLLVPNGSKSSVNITDKLSGGNVGGYRQFVNEVLNSVQNDIGRIAVAFAHTFNEQLKAGLDLHGNPGIAMFSEPPITIVASNRNTSSGPVTATITDYTALTGSDYQINVTGSETVVTNLRTNAITKYPAPGNLSFNLEGIDFDINGSNAGDSYLIQPTRNVASSITLSMDVINDADKIAAAANSLTPAVGDNANALKLADLQLAKTSLKQGSFQDAYNEVVGAVGVLTQSSKIDATAQKQMLDAVRKQRDAVAGVNLDEEAANLIQFQQAYQAAAQVISVAKSTFDAIIGAVR